MFNIIFYVYVMIMFLSGFICFFYYPLTMITEHLSIKLWYQLRMYTNPQKIV